jgi:hypothetical protein
MFCGLAAVASATQFAAAPPAAAAPVEVGHAVKADKSPPLRSIAPRAQPVGATAPQVRHREIPATSASPLIGNPTASLTTDPVQQLQAPTASAPAALTSWDGIANIDAVVPPDTEGDVGPNDYVQWVNLSLAIWSKSGTLLLGPEAGSTLWAGFGGTNDVCANNNQGDPVVVYDRLADRWVFTQFGFTGTGNSGPYYMCMAVSTTGDPTGSYYRYEFQINSSTGAFPDYPKLGVWPDGYYLTTNNFSHNRFAGAGFYAFDRTKMLAGDSSASMITFTPPGSQYEGVLPATLTGPTAPPAGSPEYFGSIDTNSSSGTGSTFQIWKAHADFATPANSTLTTPTLLTVASYNWMFCGQLFPTGCIPQPGTTQTVDPLADRLMFRLQYRNFGDHETLVASHTVNVGSGSDRAGVRWYEIRSPGSSPVVTQQGTFAPADSIHRWMGSAAMDGNGDIALGYSASAATGTYPSVFYTGRLASDPLGTMTQGEGVLAAGAGSQTGVSRWGDYSTMSIDPSDDQTFWYTQEYYSTSSSSGWKTRIGSFRLAGGPTVTLTSPANGSSTSNTTPTFSGTAGTAAGDSSTVTVNVYSGTGTGGALVQSRSTTVAGDGSWSVAASPALTDGTYTARAQQSNSSTTGYSSLSTFKVDTLAPTVTLTAPANGSSINSSAPAFSGAAGTASGDSATVTVHVYSGTGTGGTLVQTLTTIRSGGSWTVNASSALSDGTYTAQAKQSDAAGNTGSSSANTFTVDTTAPAVTLTAPATGAITNSTTPTFSGAAGTASGDSSTVTVHVYNGTGTGGTLLQTLTTTRSSGTWTVNASPALSDGTYTAQAQQTDAAGNTGSSSANTFTIDTTAPAVTITSPAIGSSTSNTTPAFSGTAGTATGDSTTVTVHVYDGTGTGGTLVQTLTTTRSGTNWTVNASPALAQGTYTAQAQQADTAGNTGSSSANTFTVDTTAPAVTLTAPTTGAVTNNTTPAFSGAAGTASGDSATVTVRIYTGTGTGGTLVQTLTTTRIGGSWTVNASPAPVQGTYTAQAQQTDAAGNTGSSTANTFTVDTTAPAVTLTAPTTGAVTNNTTPAFSGTAGTASGDATTVTVHVYSGTGTGGTLVQTLTTTRSSGSWTVNASPALSDGTYTAQAQQSDTAGNTGSSTANTFTVDTTAPAVTLTAPANGAVTSNTTPPFSGAAGTASGDSATVTVHVYSGTVIGGTLVRTLTTTSSAGSWSVNASPALSDGTYTAQAQQTDVAGNTGSSSANTFTIDTTAPIVTLTSPAYGSLSNNTTPTFSGAAGTASGDSTTVTVHVYNGTGTGGTLVQTLTTTRSGSSWTVNALPALAQGTYTAQAQQSNSISGNTGYSTANTFTIDTTAPIVTLTAPANGTSTNNVTPTFSGAAGAASGDSATVTVHVYSGTGTGGTLLQTRTTTRSSGSWTVGASPALSDGTYTAQAQQADTAGNTGSSSANTFTVDTTVPIASFTFAPATPLVAQSVSFDGGASNDPDGSIVSWSWDFGDGSPLGSGSQATHAYAFAGSYSASLTVADDATNTSSVAQTVNVSAAPGQPSANTTPQQPPPSSTTTNSTPGTKLPPLLAYLQIPPQRLAAVRSHGLKLKLGANAPSAATLRVIVGSATAKRLRLAATGKQVVLGHIALTLRQTGMVSVVVKFSRPAARKLATVSQLPLTLRLRVVDPLGRSTTLTTRTVLRS